LMRRHGIRRLIVMGGGEYIGRYHQQRRCAERNPLQL
jgi:hypothetical protein